MTPANLQWRLGHLNVMQNDIKQFILNMNINQAGF